MRASSFSFAAGNIPSENTAELQLTHYHKLKEFLQQSVKNMFMVLRLASIGDPPMTAPVMVGWHSVGSALFVLRCVVRQTIRLMHIKRYH
jgi:hypothetical protein